MSRYAILFSLACATILDAALSSDAVSASISPLSERKARTVWPFSSASDASAEPAISGVHALLLEQAGLDKSFNLSSHPLWKIHKYHGIDLKPVEIQTEIIKSTNPPSHGGRDLTSAQSDPSGASVGLEATSELPDLTFLNDLGGLADFLPEPEEEEVSELIGDAIKKEESSHPGFFKRLWWKIWGTPESLSASENSATQQSTSAPSTLDFLSSFFGFAQTHQETQQETQQETNEKGSEEEDALTIHLPETQGSYMAIVLPALPGEKAKDPLAPQQVLPPSPAVPPLFREAYAKEESKSPSNHANRYPDGTGVTALPADIEHVKLPLGKPVAQWPVPGAALGPAGSESEAWIQSWTPHAAYTVHVQGPSSQQISQKSGVSSELEPSAPSGTKNDSAEPILEALEDTQPGKQLQQQATRKSSQDLAVVADEAGQTQQQSPEINEKKGDEKDPVKEILSHFHIPEGLMKKLQVSQKDVDNVLNDKESAARAAERLRSLQREFEMRKEQLNYVYATRVKKH